jgi:hypothetical protein
VLECVVEVGVVEEVLCEEAQPLVDVLDAGSEGFLLNRRRKPCVVGGAPENLRDRLLTGLIGPGVEEPSAHAFLEPCVVAFTRDLQPRRDLKFAVGEIEAKQRLADVMEKPSGLGDCEATATASLCSSDPASSGAPGAAEVAPSLVSAAAGLVAISNPSKEIPSRNSVSRSFVWSPARQRSPKRQSKYACGSLE